MAGVADEPEDMADSIAGKWICTPVSIVLWDFPIPLNGFDELTEVLGRDAVDQVLWIEFVDSEFLRIRRKIWSGDNGETLGAIYSLTSADSLRCDVATLTVYELKIFFVSYVVITVLLIQDDESLEIILQEQASVGFINTENLRGIHQIDLTIPVNYSFTREDNKRWNLGQ